MSTKNLDITAIKISLKFTIQVEETRVEYVENLSEIIGRMWKIINRKRTQTL